jgi:hypothetical protein
MIQAPGVYCPVPLCPQAHTDPSSFKAKACLAPAPIAILRSESNNSHFSLGDDNSKVSSKSSFGETSVIPSFTAPEAAPKKLYLIPLCNFPLQA